MSNPLVGRLLDLSDQIYRLKNLANGFGFMIEHPVDEHGRAIGELSWTVRERFEEIEADLKAIIAGEGGQEHSNCASSTNACLAPECEIRS